MYKQARVSLGIELSRTHKKLPTVVAPGKEDMGWLGDGPSLTIIASEFMPSHVFVKIDRPICEVL